MGFRKTIVNSSVKGDDMKKLAKELNSKKCHAMVFNQTGLTVYNCETSATMRFKTKGRSFNELLFYAYKVCNLATAPLFIVGRRKVDRGLGFHYAPRSHLGIPSIHKELNFEMGPLQLDGSEGLIWTDEFLGHVVIKETAVQKAGRLAGIVAQCPQYPLHLTWWTDEETAAVVKRHYEIVDAANKQGGCHTMVQALERAKIAVPEEPTQPNVVDIKTYRIYQDEASAKEACKILKYRYNATPLNAEGFKETSLNSKKEVSSLADAIKKVPTAYGTNKGVVTYRTYLPCYTDTTDSTTLMFVVIIRPDDVDSDKVKEVDAKFPSIIV